MPLEVAYSPNYFSLDDILATQERTSCKFLQNAPKLGILNSSAEEPDLPAGIQLELPVWLVLETSSGRQPVTSAELPKVYRESYREILKADPTVIELPKFGLYFYELGSHIKYWDRRGDVAEILIYVFKMRFRHLLDLTDNSISQPKIIQSLDMLEKTLFRSGFAAKEKLNNWLKYSEISLQPANMIVNLKKRKRIDISDT